MSIITDFLNRLIPGSRRSSDWQIAEASSQRLLHLLAGPVNLYGFDFKAIPLKPEIQTMLGFLAAATDVLAHDAGGQLSGPGSINGTLRVYQSLFDERHTEALMESTFELYKEGPEAFEEGRRLGINFAVSFLRQDTDTPARIMIQLLSQKYRKYCRNPDGVERRS